MKKIVSLLLVMLLLACSAAYAESIDVAGMPDDELIALYESVKAEMQERGISHSSSKTLIEGKYIVGEDIEPGDYIITCTQSIGDDLQDAYSGLGDMYDSLPDTEGVGNVFDAFGSMMGGIGATVEILGDYGDVISTTMLKTGESVDISLKEGTALNITDGTFTLEQK